MSLPEAQQFVAQFIKGEYTPGDYAAFLGWLKVATVEELNTVADTHESLHINWALSGGPSVEWVGQLEQKLDKTVAPVLRMRSGKFGKRNAWMAAASVGMLLSAGTYMYVRQVRSGSVEMQSREKALTLVFSNPRGGELKEMVLQDGSKVWLNAASTLKYPPRFAGSERLVELSGEAIFEVAGSSGSPFRVLIKDAEVEVLGTHFDIMAYDDEPISRTTLIDGAVKIKSGEDSVTLKPRQQAEVRYPLPGVDAAINVSSDIDPNKALAWKDGSLSFVQADVRTIMRVISRAYNVDVQYETNVTDLKINCAFKRVDALNSVLKQLGYSFDIRFINDGKTVIVTSI